MAEQALTDTGVVCIFELKGATHIIYMLACNLQCLAVNMCGFGW
jgi:hypothetical protein